MRIANTTTTSLDTFADFQLCLVDVELDRPVALANCVPTAFSGDLDDLPEEGWDWLVESGATGAAGRSNVLGALAISVPAVHRGKGYATRMLREMGALSKQRGFDALIAPVRPTIEVRITPTSRSTNMSAGRMPKGVSSIRGSAVTCSRAANWSGPATGRWW